MAAFWKDGSYEGRAFYRYCVDDGPRRPHEIGVASCDLSRGPWIWYMRLDMQKYHGSSDCEEDAKTRVKESWDQYL